MKVTWTDIMGLPITLEALGPRADEAAAAAVRTWLEHVDAVFSTYKPESEISQINDGRLAPQDASDEVQEVLRACAELKATTGGYFAIEYQGQIDPSGYVKGWAVKRATELLEARGITSYCLEAGGDIQVRGGGPEGKPWRVGITNPLEPAQLAKVLMLTDGAVATSGTYKRGHHIYNPLTGQPVTDPVSLTVVGTSIERVDALATAAICMGKDGLSWLAAQGYEGMMITAAAEVFLTPGFKRYELTAA